MNITQFKKEVEAKGFKIINIETKVQNNNHAFNIKLEKGNKIFFINNDYFERTKSECYFELLTKLEENNFYYEEKLTNTKKLHEMNLNELEELNFNGNHDLIDELNQYSYYSVFTDDCEEERYKEYTEESSNGYGSLYEIKKDSLYALQNKI